MHRKLTCTPVRLFLLIILSGAFFILPAFPAHPDNPPTEEELSRLTGKERLTALVELAKHNCRAVPSKTLQYGREALELLKAHPSPAQELEIMIQLSWAYNHLRNTVQAMEWGQKSLNLARKTNNVEATASALNSLGFSFFLKNEYRNALDYFKKARENAEKSNDKGILGKNLYNTGNVYFTTGDYSQAADYYFRSLPLVEKHGSRFDLALVYNSIGAVYTELRDFNQGLEYHGKCLKLLKEIGYQRGISTSYNNIGSLYSRLQKHEKALQYYQKSLVISEELGDPKKLPMILNNLGDTYVKLNNHTKALQYYNRSLVLSRKHSDRYNECFTLASLSVTYMELNRFQTALSIANKALVIAKELNIRKVTADCYENLFKIYTAMRNHRKADEFQHLNKELVDTLVIERVQSNISKLKTKYETEKKEKEIELLRREHAIDALEITQQKQLRNFLIAGLVLLGGIVILLINRYRLKIRANKESREKNRALRHAYEELTGAQKELDRLEGLLPICSECKRIRDGDGYWHPVDSYIRKHTDADLSHSICPSCLQKSYRDVDPGDKK